VTQAPPHSPELESAVLSAWSVHDRFSKAWKPVPELFYLPEHRLIAEAMGRLEGPRDQASIIAQLDSDGSLAKAGGPANVFRVLTDAPAYGDPWPHVQHLHEFYALRESIRIIQAGIAEAYEHKNLGAFMAQVQECGRVAASETGSFTYSPADLFREIYTFFEAKQGAMCFPTGLPTIDANIGGLLAGHVTVIAAATNFGKSAIALMLADNMLHRGHRPLIVSFEDDPLLYGRRLLARRAQVSPSVIRHPDRIPVDSPIWKQVAVAASEAETSKFFLNGIGKTVERVSTDLRCILAAENIDCVIVDYLQAAQCSRRQQDRRNEVAYVMRTLTDTIKIARRAGVVLSQIRRLPPGQKPTKHDVKEAGDVENTAENVIVGYVDKEGRHMLCADKVKDGVGGFELALHWNEKYFGFDGELATDQP